MDIFSRNKFLTRIVIALVLINLFAVGYLWYSAPERNPAEKKRKDFREVSALLKEKLNLSDAQEQQLTALRQDFFQKEKELSALIKSERDSMNENMFSDDPDTSGLNTLARRVADNEYRMEQYRIDQAAKFRAICTKEQRELFGRMVLDIRDYFRPEKRK